MKKVYVLAPLAGLLTFGGFYWRHARVHEQRVAETRRHEAALKQEKLARQQAAQREAVEQASMTVARRNQERAEKERLEEAQKKTRLELEQRRNTASEQSRRLRSQIDGLRREVDAVDAAIGRGEERTRELRQEEQFLSEYVKQAEANRAAIYRLLEKLEAIEKTRSAATGPSRTQPPGKG